MFRLSIAALTFGLFLLLASWCTANDYDAHEFGGDSHGCCGQCDRGGLFGWRSYSHEERRNFPTCYGGYERYYGGFHANYFRDYPGNFDGLTNGRYGWGNGWAW
jgi:hypothetical protein